jgi:hypothetical protein
MDKLAITVTNSSSHGLYIDRDPNWDDQVLTIDGQPQYSIYLLKPGSSAVVGVTSDYAGMGVIFATTENYDHDDQAFYQLEIGQNDAGDQDVIGGGPFNTPTVSYTLQDQKPLSMTMVFTDANA